MQWLRDNLGIIDRAQDVGVLEREQEVGLLQEPRALHPVARGVLVEALDGHLLTALDIARQKEPRLALDRVLDKPFAAEQRLGHRDALERGLRRGLERIDIETTPE